MKSMMVVLVIFLLSCTGSSIQSKAKEADRIEVVDTETGFSHTDTSALVVKGFREVLDGKPEVTDCPVQGTVSFKKGDKVKLQVGYYKDATACSFLVVTDGNQRNGYRLTHNALTYLGYYFQGLKKKKHGQHN